MTATHRSSALDACLRTVWRRTWRRHAVAGLLALVAWAVPSFVAAVAIDWFADLPDWLRGCVAVAIVAVSLRAAWRQGWRHLRRFDPSRTAVEVEKHAGGMESLLVTAVQFGRSGASPGTSESMWAVTQRLAEEAAARVSPVEVASFRPLGRAALVALGLAAAVAAWGVVEGPLLRAGATRIFAPWLAAAYPTKTHIDLAEGDLVVKEGDRAEIVATISGVVPEQAVVALETGAGRSRDVVLDVVDGRCEYELASASRDFRYRIKAGDARSEWRRVRVVSAPRIEKVRVDREYPAYLDRAADSVEALTLTVPENTRVRWHLTLDRPVRDAVLHRDGAEPLPLAIDADGRRLVLEESATASRGYSFSWVDTEHGFEFTSPRSYLQVAADQPPRVELTTPAANLRGLIGRPLPLAIRAQDDHGLGPATITYQVNQRPEKTVTIETPIRNGEGEQPLDWDYRTALTDLQEDDTVSFVVEVSDRYPGEGGPHRARSDLRRITFLSRADYLAEIEKQMNRLLSRVHTIYRQERAAHELVRGLDPKESRFLQTCQLEAIRQEMVREQLMGTAREVGALLDDLAANNVTDAVESGTLDTLRQGLEGIAGGHVARAAALLREQAGLSGSGTADVGPASRVVNEAARDLARLVLQRSIESAREVFARETRMLAEEQAWLRLRGIDGAAPEGLAAAEDELADWTGQLLADLRAGMRYDRRPLAVLALIRRMKDLDAAGAERRMREAAGFLRAGQAAEAAAAQSATIVPLLAAGFSARTGSEYEAVMEARRLLDSLVEEQQRLRGDCAGNAGSTAASAAVQQRLRERLLLAAIPAIPAPRSRLFDDVLQEVPPSVNLRLAAEQAMGQALAALQSGDRAAAVEHQRKAEAALEPLRDIVARWSVELGTRSQGLSSLVSDATDRATRIEEYETRQIGLLEKTEEAALDETQPEKLAEPQQFLAEEVARFRKELAGAADAKPSKDWLPLVARLDRATGAMDAARTSLVAKRPAEAVSHQELAADALAAARTLADAQRERLSLLQNLFSFEQSVLYAGDSMGDVVAEQGDLAKAAGAADEDRIATLLPEARNLRQCLAEVAPVLDLVAGRLDVGTPLVFAGSDVEDAIAALEDGDGEEAGSILEEAAGSLAEVRARVAAVQRQTGYVAEIVEFLHETQADAAVMGLRQEQLGERLALLTGPVPAEILSDQQGLQAKAEAWGREVARATGLKTAAVAGMTPAAEALAAAAEELSLAITVLHGLPAIEVTSASPAELQRLLDVLALASEHQQLLRQTTTAGADARAEIASRQRKLAEVGAALASSGTPHPLLVAAQAELAKAGAALDASAREVAVGHQGAANDALRHFVIEQAMLLGTAVPPPMPGDPVAEAETDDLDVSTANLVSDFVSGEAPKDKRTEWEMLGSRNRAALNQNFARELPLEYRATLKNYYERVAK